MFHIDSHLNTLFKGSKQFLFSHLGVSPVEDHFREPPGLCRTLSADSYFPLLPPPHPLQIILSLGISGMSSDSNWSVASVIPGRGGLAFRSAMLSVVQASQNTFCEKFCDYITSKVKQKTNTIIFT